jgi:hypothetical protein
VYLALGKHGHVFDLRFAQMRAVGGDKNELRLLFAKGLDGGLVSEDNLSGLHHHLQATVHRVLLLLLHSSRKGRKNVRYGSERMNRPPELVVSYLSHRPRRSVRIRSGRT